MTDTQQARGPNVGSCVPARRRAIVANICIGLAAITIVNAGAADPFPAQLELHSLLPASGGDGREGFVLDGVEINSTFGMRLSGGRDLNGDGYDDMVVSAMFAAPHGRPYAGQASVIFGGHRRWRPEVNVARLLPANGSRESRGFVVNGIDPEDTAGQAIKLLCDVNGDHLSDLVISAPGAMLGDEIAVGEIYVVFGSRHPFPPEFELSDLLPANGGDGSAGFVMRGSNSIDVAGSSVDTAGDINGDGVCDLVVGAVGIGGVYVVLGSTEPFPAQIVLSSLQEENGGDGSVGFVIDGGDSGMTTGDSAIGDINGDGLSDLSIGARCNGVDSWPCKGTTFVIFGSRHGFGAKFSLASLLSVNGGDGRTGFVISEAFRNDGAIGADRIGDVNGDGVDDLIIGALSADPNGITSAGASYVVYGRRDAFEAEFALADLLPVNGGDGVAGFVINGFRSGELTAAHTQAAGDINADGIDDFMISAHHATVNGFDKAGVTYVLYGRKGYFPAQFNLSDLLVMNGGDGTLGFVLQGGKTRDLTGSALARAGDVNRDGIDDILVGSPGRVFVIFGRRKHDQ